MVQVTVITVGNLKEAYWRDAMAEYEKRLGAFCKPEILQLKEAKLSDNPSEGEIKAALADEGKRILSAIPPRSYKIAMCVEGKQFSSEELAAKLDGVLANTGSLCLIIGSSYGLSDAVKARADLKLSFSRLTLPHHLIRVVLAEAIYRSFTILSGKKYHK